MTRTLPIRLFRLATVMVVALILSASLSGIAKAADRGKLRAFLEVTGFDKAIEGLQDGAVAGPALAGDAPDAFGSEWVRLAREIFNKQEMVDQALDMMEAILPDELVNHAAAFYASDLGQRLVAAENASITVPDEEKYATASKIMADLVDSDPARIELFRQMNEAIGGIDQSVRSVIEVQVRYLMAAMAAGSSDLDMSEQDLRGMLEAQSDEIRQNVEIYSILGAVYTYRDFSDDEMRAYLEALQQPQMRQVYEVLNGIQFEVMAERYERLAAAIAGLAPQTDL